MQKPFASEDRKREAAIWFIGDVHGQFPTYEWALKHFPLPGGAKGLDCSLQVGDFGVFTARDYYKFAADPQHRFIRGNHDNPWICKDHPSYLGDYGYEPNAGLFFIGGGMSIDAYHRTLGKTWWPEEELSYLQFKDALQQFGDFKPTIVTSHECPSVVKGYALPAVGQDLGVSHTEGWLQVLYESHQPDLWIFGHYHKRVDVVIGKTRFVGLNDTRGPLKELVFEVPGVTWSPAQKTGERKEP